MFVYGINASHRHFSAELSHNCLLLPALTLHSTDIFVYVSIHKFQISSFLLSLRLFIFTTSKTAFPRLSFLKYLKLWNSFFNSQGSTLGTTSSEDGTSSDHGDEKKVRSCMKIESKVMKSTKIIATFIISYKTSSFISFDVCGCSKETSVALDDSYRFMHDMIKCLLLMRKSL